jgi:hypothetical protein
MELHVRIPDSGGGSFFTLFADGKMKRKTTVPEEGTFITLEGVCALFYKYPHCRRAYIVRGIDELHGYAAVCLPNVQERTGILFRARGRQIDLLRKALYFLIKTDGLSVYTYETLFWQRVVCLIEMCGGRYSGRLKYNLEALSGGYRRTHAAHAAFPFHTPPPEK